jgi:mannose-6-phosphate isomerase
LQPLKTFKTPGAFFPGYIKHFPTMYLLEGVVQPYAWGGHHYIPELLGLAPEAGKPAAEYWLGVHPGGPSRIRLDGSARTSLPDLIRSDPRRYLGERVLADFENLPFLLKVLDVEGMLSIQVHPTREGAREGYARENALGIPLDAPQRNYRDENHKPEVMVALSEFWLLHGFRRDVESVLASVPELSGLADNFREGGIEGLYRQVMEMPQEAVDALLLPLAQRIVPLYRQGGLDRASSDFWAGRVLAGAAPDFRNIDRGVFSIYLFNVVHMHAGQAIFQGAGIPHAYLEGRNVELMSNSDNVLRAGLTPKHVDIPELMRHTSFEPVVPKVMDGLPDGGFRRYPCPVPDFSIDTLEMRAGVLREALAEGPEVWLQMSGRVRWEGYRSLVSGAGQAVFVLPGERCRLEAEEDAMLFRAYVP